MTDTAKGKPSAVMTLNGCKLPGKPAILLAGSRLPRAIGRVNGRDRPTALPMPAERNVSALSQPSVLEKWGEEAAGIRAVEKGDNVITMFDLIGEDFWSGGGITAKSVTAQLRAIGDRPIEVQINSPGGDMFEGIAIYNVLREHPQPITVKIMGMAASAASIIAMAGDSVEIGAASFLMIHNCWVVAVGNRHDMAETAAYLGPFDQAMADVYAFRTGKTAAECGAWMDAETYMSGSVAIERGFADTLLGADQVTRDEAAKASDRERTAITALELKLVAGGDTRAQAREHITKIKGTPGAARDAVDTPGAVGTELVGSLASLLSTFRQNPE
jgi:ATP-dependent Clp protease, protease subunit